MAGAVVDPTDVGPGDRPRGVHVGDTFAATLGGRLAQAGGVCACCRRICFAHPMAAEDAAIVDRLATRCGSATVSGLLADHGAAWVARLIGDALRARAAARGPAGLNRGATCVVDARIPKGTAGPITGASLRAAGGALAIF